MRALTKIVITLTTILILFTTSCKEGNIVTPTPPKPPGYQEDIPWPSLANSPWPMIHGNPQLNGRSISGGPVSGELVWKTEFFTKDTYGDTFLSPVFRDSTVYFVSYQEIGDVRSHLYSLGVKTGEIEWKFPLENYKTTSPPITTSSGSIYVADWNQNVYLINKNGQLVWKIVLPSVITSTMNIGMDGILYAFAQSGILYAIDKDGSIKWEKDLIDEFGSSSSAIAFSPDGNTMYITGNKLTAITIDGTIKWTLSKDTWENTWQTLPIVDSDGNIFLFGGAIKINSDGEKIDWIGQSLGTYANDPTIDKNGNVYIGLISGEIASINYNGELNWKQQFQISDATSIICNNNSQIFLISSDQFSRSSNILCINSDGALLWQYYFEGKTFYSPALGTENLFFGSVGENGKYFYCIK